MSLVITIEQLHALATILSAIDTASIAPDQVIALVEDGHKVIELMAGDRAGEIYDNTDEEAKQCLSALH